MYRKFNLQQISTRCGLDLVFEWDAEAGLFRGRDALAVEQLIAEAVRDGIVLGHPYPTPFNITDPARNPADLAVVLGQHWKLPKELARVSAQVFILDSPVWYDGIDAKPLDGYSQLGR